MAVELDCLYFFCNRPTIAALMGFGRDMSEVNNYLKVRVIVASAFQTARAADTPPRKQSVQCPQSCLSRCDCSSVRT